VRDNIRTPASLANPKRETKGEKSSTPGQGGGEKTKALSGPTGRAPGKSEEKKIILFMKGKSGGKGIQRSACAHKGGRKKDNASFLEKRI